MVAHSTIGRRTAAGALGIAAVTGACLAAAASASAAPPNCTAADLAGVNAGVSAASATYLFTHPDVNAFLTSLSDKPEQQARTELEQYLNANPRIRDELGAVRQPLVDLKARCEGPAS